MKHLAGDLRAAFGYEGCPIVLVPKARPKTIEPLRKFKDRAQSPRQVPARTDKARPENLRPDANRSQRPTYEQEDGRKPFRPHKAPGGGARPAQAGGKPYQKSAQRRPFVKLKKRLSGKARAAARASAR